MEKINSVEYILTHKKRNVVIKFCLSLLVIQVFNLLQRKIKKYLQLQNFFLTDKLHQK